MVLNYWVGTKSNDNYLYKRKTQTEEKTAITEAVTENNVR